MTTLFALLMIIFTIGLLILAAYFAFYITLFFVMLILVAIENNKIKRKK